MAEQNASTPTGAQKEAEPKMLAMFLPGNSTVELRQVPVPTLTRDTDVLVRIRASTICGSDIRCIYKEHLGQGPERYQNVIAGHEPCGEVVRCGKGTRRFQPGDRVVIYHISGCGVCVDCRKGFMISCRSEKFRRAYGWQRDGGMAEFCVAEEKDLLPLPEGLTFLDGALVACGFGTVFEALTKIQVSGRDSLLVTGMGPVGLAAAVVGAKLGAKRIICVDRDEDRCVLGRGLIVRALSRSKKGLEGQIETASSNGGGQEGESEGSQPPPELHVICSCSGSVATGNGVEMDGDGISSLNGKFNFSSKGPEGIFRMPGTDAALDLIRCLCAGGKDFSVKSQGLNRNAGAEKSIDCSGNAEARALCVRGTKDFGCVALVGEGGKLSVDASPDVIHGQKMIYGSWVTSVWLMEELLCQLEEWGVHPEDLVTHAFPLQKSAEAYEVMSKGGKCGKVGMVVQ
uniref:Enoyl reductase (ER) domain-containing protein n=1 Tax=Chromera velia CCMP2878 TaxID=1169474 RepID=A0A0G4FYT5_9ALVE|eukprot:Cvel_19322.t1-p1 / transcript=Cvel_19322.t1 / gene=Cvel_19322 / organism=Chromera_velia_CCMP2878 / gene_product=Uncharacterized zinc-type alcohol, putative / transcript_product=Uncharacterized zinc-type alcohol, putative / location=Cvel_scaffold1657:17087-18454(+) / protein_length=456 / sequence_SO=supercontig / SO=protein_coding / is_pseudo=false